MARNGASFRQLPLDVALSDFPVLRAPLAAAALRSCAAGGILQVQTTGQGAEPGALFWSHRQRLWGLELGLAEVGAGPAPQDDYIAQAERALEAASRFGKVDIMTLQIAESAPTAKPPRGFQRAMGGAYLAVERGLARRESLPLLGDYAGFLQSLGHDTRRNMHRYRRKAGAAGFSFRFATEAPPRTEAALRHGLGALTEPRPKSPRRIDAHDGFIADRTRPYWAALEGRDGRPASIAAGFITGDSAYLVYQLNDAAHGKLSLSLVLRGYLIEALLELGVRELIFPNGCSGLLQAACTQRRGVVMILLRRSLVGLAKTLAVAAFAETHYVRKATISAARHDWRQWRSGR